MPIGDFHNAVNDDLYQKISTYRTTMQVVYELPATSQWIFEVHWCPRNPAIISTASFDGHISMYSLLGGGARGGASATKEQQVHGHSVPYLYIHVYSVV